MAFGFLEHAYRYLPGLTKLSLVTDQPQFYTLITTLLSTDLLVRYQPAELEKRILEAGKILDEIVPAPDALKKAAADYRVAAIKQTTDTSKREKRQKMLVKIIDPLEV